MDANKVLKQIREENLADLLPDGGIPIILACLRQDTNFTENIGVIAKVAHWFGKTVQTFYTLEDLLPYFMERYSFEGTPTYLFFRRGALLGLLRGKRTAEELVSFIRGILEDTKENLK